MKKEKDNGFFNDTIQDGEKSNFELLIMHKAFRELTGGKKKNTRGEESENGKEN